MFYDFMGGYLTLAKHYYFPIFHRYLAVAHSHHDILILSLRNMDNTNKAFVVLNCYRSSYNNFWYKSTLSGTLICFVCFVSFEPITRLIFAHTAYNSNHKYIMWCKNFTTVGNFEIRWHYKCHECINTTVSICIFHVYSQSSKEPHTQYSSEEYKVCSISIQITKNLLNTLLNQFHGSRKIRNYQTA